MQHINSPHVVPVESSRGLLSRIAAWYERFPYPRLVLTIVFLAIYGIWLIMPFFIDDYRALRNMQEFRQGQRTSMDLYQFFKSAEYNRAQRQANWLPWWVSDDVRAQLLRPVAEWSLYLDYLIFGKGSPVGFHATQFLTFVLSAWMVLSLFRTVQPNEARARWGALLFTMAASNAITVVFISARCDLLAVMFTLIAMLCGLRFARYGELMWVPIALAATLLALFSKEASAPLLVGFGLLWLVTRKQLDGWEQAKGDLRAKIQLALLFGTTLVWFVIRFTARFETNSVYMLDPVRRPMDYLRQAPMRILSYFTAWPLPINPAAFYWRESGFTPLLIFTAISLGIALLLVWYFRRRPVGDPSVLGFGIWAIMFLPVVSCTLPDSRLLMLPCIGASYVGACWIRGQYDRSRWLGRFFTRYVPAFLLILLPLPVTFGTLLLFSTLELKAEQDIRAVGTEIAKNTDIKDPHAIIVATPSGVQNSWTQDRAWYLFGDKAPIFILMTDVWDVIYEVTGERTLRMYSVEERFVSTFSQVGMPTGKQMKEGERFTLPEYEVTLVTCVKGRPTVMDVRFKDPLNSPRYFFYQFVEGAPERWHPVLAEKIRFGVNTREDMRQGTSKPAKPTTSTSQKAK